LIAHNFPLDRGLWLVGVPIGTARDITLRALDVLANADMLVAEDTRSLRKLMDIHGIALNGRRIQSFNDHSKPGDIERIIQCLKDGQSVAYASEAGMPLISDPGFELVRAAHEAAIKVTAAPGPTALTTALALAGLPTDKFLFAGFLPATQSARKAALQALKDVPATLVFYESPKRLAKMLADAADVLGPDRQARICRELTKKFEETRPGTLSALADELKSATVKGEIVVLVDRASDTALTAEDVKDALNTALKTMSVKDAAAFVAQATGMARKDVYRMALDLKD
jgi:16S rRNA (cytidine1402-2'-O)-methyltransferase